MRERRIHLLIFMIAALRCVAATTAQADKIVIVKSVRTMTLLSSSKVLKTYKVALGSVPVGPNGLKAITRRPRGIT
jgi:hypothetical protein